MSYFNLNINDDINYLLGELGHNCKVNNTPAKVIVNNSSMERTHDDKKIITKDILTRGDYIEYNDLYFITLNEINDKRYSTYYKAIIRACNYDVRFVLNGKLYLFYSIIESDKFNVDSGKYITTLADTITITLPDTDTTKLIQEENRIIKFGKAWSIQGIDYTRKGLIQLKLKVAGIQQNDNVEKEIANFDLLTNPEQEPILPFDIDDNEPVEPEPEPEPPTEDNFTITLEGDDDMNIAMVGNYTATVYNNGVEIDEPVTFSIDDDYYARIKEYTSNTCILEAYEFGRYGAVMLFATLNIDESVFAQKEVLVTGI